MNMIRAAELQIGDWIVYNGNKYQVTYLYCRPLYPDGTFPANEVGFTHKEDFWVNGASVEPIPLTEDILKLNGFVKTDEYYYQRINGDDVYVSFPKEDSIFPYVDITYTSLIHNPEDVTEVSHSNGLIFPKKMYVHQFQQVLRICSLVDFANNLKIQ